MHIAAIDEEILAITVRNISKADISDISFISLPLTRAINKLFAKITTRELKRHTDINIIGWLIVIELLNPLKNFFFLKIFLYTLVTNIVKLKRATKNAPIKSNEHSSWISFNK